MASLIASMVQLAPRVPARRAFRALCAALLFTCLAGHVPAAPAAGTAWGFTPFPYDFTPEAVNKTFDVVANNASLYAIHRDDGVPWQEALDDKPFPKKMTEEWESFARHIKPNQKVYVGLAPLAMDRESLADIAEGSKTSKSFRKKPINSPDVIRAYTNYVRRAITIFKPDYLNVGIEVGELVARDTSRWREFEELFAQVKATIKKEHPGILVGISFGLQSLMKPANAKLASALVERSDYIGISFYPYMSPFHEVLGSPPLEAPPAQWTKPLAWLRSYTKKPIALCETGYATKRSFLEQPAIEMAGDAALQKRYLTELAGIAQRDRYLFVAWFLPIDYEALSKRAGFKPGSAMRLWENVGLFGADLKPKPAWAVWQDIVAGKETPAAAVATTPDKPTPVAEVAPAAAAVHGFDPAQLAKQAKPSKDDKLELSEDGPPGAGKAVRWSFQYAAGRFQWFLLPITKGALAGGKGMRVTVKGEQASFVLVSFEEKSGEAYWAVVPVKTGWTSVDLPLKSFRRDEKKPKSDGQFQPGDVISMTVADARALEGAKGQQSVWLAGWSIY